MAPAAEFAQNIKSVHIRKTQIQQNHVRIYGVGQNQAFRARERGGDLVFIFA